MTFPYNVFLLAILGGGLTTAISLPLWRLWCRRFGVVDEPGQRKLQSAPIPLAGGLAVLSGILLPMLAAAAVLWRGGFLRRLLGANTGRLLEHGLDKEALQIVAIISGALAILLIGLFDDKFELRPSVKFTGQLLVALGIAAAGLRITLFVPNVVFNYAITALWIVTVVNAFNFMDNMDGLCAGLGLVGAWYFGIITAINGQYLVATTAFLVVGALAGFLPYNFPKAGTYLGDSGSHLVGYLLAVLAILPHFYTASHPKKIAVLTPLLVLAVPLADLAWVVLLRWRAGKPFYVGDRNHLSHRLERRGLSRPQAVLLIWFLAAALGALAFLWQ